MYESTINALWRHAGELLRNAEKIVVIGYSFPRTDSQKAEKNQRRISGSERKLHYFANRKTNSGEGETRNTVRYEI